MPFGLAIQVQTQDQEDKLVWGVVQDEPIPMTAEVKDARGNVVTPATPMYPSRKAWAEAVVKGELCERYVAKKTQRDTNTKYDETQAAARAALAGA